MTSPKTSGWIGAKVTLVNELMATPPPPAPPMYAAPMPMMEPPGASQVKTGLLVAGIGLILGAFLGLFLGFIGPLIVMIGGALVMAGAGKVNPGAKGTAAAGFVLVLIGFIMGILAWVLTPAIILGATTLDVLNAYATALLISFLGSLIFWIGVIIMPMKLVRGAGKGLAIAGGVLGLVGTLLVFVMVYLAVAAIIQAASGGTIDANAFIAAIAGLIIGGLMSLIGGILAGVGYIVGRGKLAVPGMM